MSRALLFSLLLTTSTAVSAANPAQAAVELEAACQSTVITIPEICDNVPRVAEAVVMIARHQEEGSHLRVSVCSGSLHPSSSHNMTTPGRSQALWSFRKQTLAFVVDIKRLQPLRLPM